MSDHSTDHRYRPLGWALALALLALWSCSTPEERYKTLSFFFDGVPLPESMRAAQATGPDGRVALVVVTHAPYANEQCKDCHGDVGKFDMSLSGYSGLNSTVCLKCHDGKQSEFRLMHGPVASMDCLACHEPHQSRYEHLLKAPAPQLCLQCHIGKDLQAAGEPSHNDLTANCLDCHYGHGGNELYFLRIDVTPPATPEGEPPAAEPAPDNAAPLESKPQDQEGGP